MSKKQIGTTVAVVVALAVVGYFLVGNVFSMEQPSLSSGASGQVVMQDEALGTGPAAKVGDVLTVNYTGKLDNGTVFDTSVGRQPFTFILGAGQVIPGWDQGLMGMQKGGKRTLIVPAGLAYGAQGIVDPQTGQTIIPPNATLTFEVELLSISDEGTE